jgi:hypothetical protein
MKPFAKTLLHSSCAAARGGPKMRRPARGSDRRRRDRAAARADDREIDRLARGEREQRVGIAGIDAAQPATRRCRHCRRAESERSRGRARGATRARVRGRRRRNQDTHHGRLTVFDTYVELNGFDRNRGHL